MGKEPSTASPSLPRIGELIAGKYTIDRILATGGMGVVVAAKHIRLDQRVAIKFLLPEMLDREELVARFLREAQATVGLHGEHAVRVYDVGTLETGSPYLVMELLRGNDLDEELEVRGPLDVDEAVDYTLQACEAIAEAHRVGIVHRDIKPSNLFLARRPDGSRIVKVVDFGISKLLADEAQRGMNNKLTTTTAMLGSPQYMSPEQVRSARDVDGRTDIWSLGCVLYEMLANVPPFSAETVSAVSAMIVADKPAPLKTLRGDAPAELCKVIMRCLEKNRERRYRTVAALAEALAPFASPRSQASADRVLRISQAPRYESSYPPASSSRATHDADTVAPGRVRSDSTTVSEASPGVPRVRPYQETLSATSAASHEERTYTRRNGVLVGVAALSAGLFVWAMLGPPPPEPAPTELGRPVRAAGALDAGGRVSRPAAPAPHRTTLDVRSAVAPSAEPASAADAQPPVAPPEAAPAAAPRPSGIARKVLKKKPHRAKPTARGSQDGSLDASNSAEPLAVPPPPAVPEPDEGPLSSRK
ncbi:MAG TPA: serine/threonine-protein kinase [Polyangiaceae bacterium]